MIGRRQPRSARPGGLLRYPARAVVVAFAVVAVLGAGLLWLPAATEAGQSAGLVAALFTSVSALCVTGLVVVDTPTYWSGLGEGVILGLIQVGGIGIMTLASLLGLLVVRRLGLSLQITAQTETKSLELGEVRGVLGRIVALSLCIESAAALVLALRFGLHYEQPAGRAVYLGVFHAVSAFNNAGFALFSDSMTSFTTDPWISLPVVVAVILGGIGFPVLFEIGRYLRRRRRHFTLHVKITAIAYGVLLALGIGAFLAFEWGNAGTLGPLGLGGKLLAGVFQGTMPRTAGFNSLEVSEFEPSTLLVNDALMFIGGGSAGTAGGIKVTTFALLAFVIVAEARGEPSVHVMGRRLPAGVQRQALSVALLGIGLVLTSTLVLLSVSPFRLDDVLFEAVSAFGTVGLSTGITPLLPTSGQLVLVVLMFLGRLGPITLASALALRDRSRRYEYPEERPIVG